MVKVLFFGVTGDIAGAHEKSYQANSFSELQSLLFQEYPKLSDCKFRIAVNGVINSGDVKLNGDEIVALLPPFAGG
jgi:sulfur-carrier protein